MLCIRGKQEKSWRESTLSLPAFFHCFHCARGFSFRSPSNMRKEVWKDSIFCRRKGAGPMALLPGVRGPHRPLLLRSSSYMRITARKNSHLHRRLGPGAMPLVRGTQLPLPSVWEQGCLTVSCMQMYIYCTSSKLPLTYRQKRVE